MTHKADIWMPLYWGDLLADTLHLSSAQFGAYLLLIGAYWRTRKPLPDNETYLRNVARYVGRNGQRQWVKDRDVLAALFQVEGGVWRHKRVEIELAAAMENKENQRQRTAAATAARHNKPAPAPNVTTNVTCSPSPSPSPVQREREISSGSLRRPKDLKECLAIASMIGMSEGDARQWYADCEVALWRRGDGTLFDNWRRQMAIHRDRLRERRGPIANGGTSPASGSAELILRQKELDRLEERMRKINASYYKHSTCDEKDRIEWKTLKARKIELLKLLGMQA